MRTITPQTERERQIEHDAYYDGLADAAAGTSHAPPPLYPPAANDHEKVTAPVTVLDNDPH